MSSPGSAPAALADARPIPRALVPRPVSWAEQARIVFGKDVRIELRTGEVVTTSAFFGLVIVIISSITYYDPRAASQVAAGAIWLATAFAAVLSLSRTWQRERQESAFDALLVSPLSPSAIFMGKALGMCTFLFAVELVIIPTTLVLFNLEPSKVALGLLTIALAATPGVAAAGALFGVITVRTRARDLVLAIVLFPLLSPTLLAAVVATRSLFDAVPLGELTGWLKVMLIFDIAFMAGGLTLFGPLADGG